MDEQFWVKSFDVLDADGHLCGSVDFDEGINTLTIERVMLVRPPDMAGPNDPISLAQKVVVPIERGRDDDGRATYFLRWVEGIEQTTRFSPIRPK